MQALQLLDYTYPSPAENLACEEALLDYYEQAGGAGVLRFWEPSSCFVVLGYSNRVATELHLPACRQDNIPILRRCSGGGTVVQLPGCLNYALVLPAPSESVTETNRWIMQRQRDAIAHALQQAGLPGEVTIEGFTDLAWNGRKFSGNSQRRKRRYVLFHGSLLLGADIACIARYLTMPSRQPAYRQNRSHEHFLCNLPLPADVVKQRLADSWGAREPVVPPPLDPRRLAEHLSPQWVYRF